MHEAKTSVAFVGSHEAIRGFAPLGLRLATPADPQDLVKVLTRLIADGCTTIFVTENLALPQHNAVVELMEKHAVSILMVPGSGETGGRGMAMIQKMAVKALGADILNVNE